MYGLYCYDSKNRSKLERERSWEEFLEREREERKIKRLEKVNGSSNPFQTREEVFIVTIKRPLKRAVERADSG